MVQADETVVRSDPDIVVVAVRKVGCVKETSYAFADRGVEIVRS